MNIFGGNNCSKKRVEGSSQHSRSDSHSHSHTPLTHTTLTLTTHHTHSHFAAYNKKMKNYFFDTFWSDVIIHNLYWRWLALFGRPRTIPVFSGSLGNFLIFQELDEDYFMLVATQSKKVPGTMTFQSLRLASLGFTRLFSSSKAQKKKNSM